MNSLFTFQKTGLSVEFKNASTGNPVSLLYNFGDGSDPVSDANPTHIYGNSGFYEVTLVATYEDPDPQLPNIEETYSKTIGVADVDWIPLDNPISVLVANFLPSNIDPDSTQSTIPLLLEKWQLFLQPLVNPEIDSNYTFNQLYWPPLVNYLIAQLIAYDLILNAANKYLIGIGASSGSDSSGSAGEVKSVRTGPAEVEWFQGSETWSEVFKQGGTFEQLTQQICMLAARLRITLYICRRLSHSPIVPRVHKVPKHIPRNIYDKGKL